jgi:predicted RNA-binding Zn ribbon-like protein
VTRAAQRPTDHRGRFVPDGGWPPGRGAPEPLERVRRFINTRNSESGADHFETAEALGGWLRHEGHDVVGEVSEAQRLRAVALRDALRDLARANGDRMSDGLAVTAMDALAERLPMTLRFGPSPALVPRAKGVDGVLAGLLATVYDAMLEGLWPRLKSCRNDHCRWTFYDRSKNGSGAWCSPLACGSRMKVRAYRARRRAEASATSSAFQEEA